MFKLRLVTTLLASVAGLGSALAAPLLVPHRAVYDLVLDQATDRSGITGLQGRMVYEFNGNECEGYTVTFRFVTQIATNDSSRVTDQQTTTFEGGDGNSFRFVTKSFVDQALDKEIRGEAKVEPDKLDVEIQQPSAQSLSLAKSQFPTRHLMEMIDKAEKGETFYETSLFDGSDDADKVMTTTVVVGKKTAAPSDDPELPAAPGLAKDQYWPVEIAYFDTGKNDGEGLPEYRTGFKLHENGVTRDLVMDYGDFSMKGKLVNFSLLKPSTAACDKPK